MDINTNFQSSNSDSRNTLTMVLAALGMIGLVFIIFVWAKPGFLFKPAQTPETKVTIPEITQTAENQLAVGFPKTFPLNAKTKITDSYSAAYPDSTAKQATVVFESSKTQKVNFDFYAKWAKTNSWQIISQSEGDALSSLYLRKSNEDINITITASSVTISYVKF